MLNMDFSKTVVINSNNMHWQASPSPMVSRKPLERAGAESGHASSIVRYAKGASFKSHKHPLGEEILVLEGVFSDEHGDYPAGSYIRNPPGSQHSPFSRQGCVILVKLCQFQKDDLSTLRIDTLNTPWLPGQGGLQVMPLHQFKQESTALVKWPAGEVFQAHQHLGGEEILVLSGTFEDEHGRYPAQTWLRSPHLSQHHPFVKEETVIWVKTGHLPL